MHIWPLSFRSLNHNSPHFSFYFYIGQEPPEDLVLREVLDITTYSVPRSWNVPCPLLSSAFWEKSEHLTPQYYLCPLVRPYCGFLTFLRLSVASSPPLFCSQSGSCLGPIGPGSYQLVMGPGGSGPRPWTQTDWLASYLHSGLCVPFPPLHAALLSELGQTEKNAAREQIWTQYTHTNIHSHLHAGTHKSFESLYCSATY